MATSLTAKQIKQLKRDAKRLKRSLGITHHEALQQLATAHHYKNWSLLNKHAQPTRAALPQNTRPAVTSLTAETDLVVSDMILDRHYLHGDQLHGDPTRFYCRQCDLVVESGHFFAVHPQQETLERYLTASERWNALPKQRTLGRRPNNPPNVLLAPAQAMLAAREAERGLFHRWLEGYVNEDTHIGDLARDILGDKNFPSGATHVEQVKEYLVGCWASSESLEALNHAWHKFEDSR